MQHAATLHVFCHLEIRRPSVSPPVILCLPRPLPAPVGPVLFIPTILRKACARSRCLPSSPFSSGPQIACSAAILAMRRPCLPLPPPFFRVSSLPLSTRQSSPPPRARCPAGLSLRPSQRTPIFPCLEKKNVCQSRTLVARSLPHHFNPLCTLPTACFRLAAALALPPVAQPAGLRFFRFGRPMASPSAPQMQRNKNRAEWSRAYPCVLTRLYTGLACQVAAQHGHSSKAYNPALRKVVHLRCLQRREAHAGRAWQTAGRLRAVPAQNARGSGVALAEGTGGQGRAQIKGLPSQRPEAPPRTSQKSEEPRRQQIGTGPAGMACGLQDRTTVALRLPALLSQRAPPAAAAAAWA